MCRSHVVAVRLTRPSACTPPGCAALPRPPPQGPKAVPLATDQEAGCVSREASPVKRSMAAAAAGGACGVKGAAAVALHK